MSDHSAAVLERRTSEAKHPTTVKTEVAIVPRVPQEIIDEILDHLAADISDFNSTVRSLRSCALVSKSWIPLSRRLLFHTIIFAPEDTARWLKMFPVPEESPAHHVRDLHLLVGGRNSVPEQFFEYTPWFTNVERMVLSGDGGLQPLWIPSSWRLPQSVTSLTVKADTVTLALLQVIMGRLPNLDDLSLSGSILAADRRTTPGVKTVLRGRFGGRLRLIEGYASEDVINTLLEIPGGLHFTEVQIRSTRECLPPTVRLAEACAKTLVKFSYTTSFLYGRGAFERSFDFSKFPNLKEVDLGIGWIGGGLLWIPPALSTLRPVTSPRLFTIQLNFVQPFTANRSVETAIEHIGDDLRRVADEVARIRCEFKGAVNVTVFRDPAFKVVLDTLDILQQ